MARRPVVGVMGGGDDVSERHLELAEELGYLIAQEGWVLLTGGRNAGVMDAASRGAKRIEGSLVVGVLPSRDGKNASEHVDLAIFTGMGDARNAINVLSCDVVVACGGGAGTASEAALALKAGRPLILLAPSAEASAFFTSLEKSTKVCESAAQARDLASSMLRAGGRQVQDRHPA